MTRCAWIIGLLALMGVGLPTDRAGAQPLEPETVPAAPAGRTGVPDLEARLLALRPSDPLAYFELAEEVSYEMPFDQGQRLARRLFVLRS